MLQDLVLAASAAEHEQHDWRATEIGDLKLGSVDGTVTRMPDTTASRAVFGSAAGDDVSPYPQLRDLLVTDAPARGPLAVVTGPSGGDKAEAEQQLLDRSLTEYGHVFSRDRVWVLDRNFRAPRGALAYRPRSGHGLEEVSVGLMAYLDP